MNMKNMFISMTLCVIVSCVALEAMQQNISLMVTDGNRNIRVVNELLEKLFSINPPLTEKTKIRIMNWLLAIAIRNNQCDMVDYLLKKGPVDVMKLGQSKLYYWLNNDDELNKIMAQFFSPEATDYQSLEQILNYVSPRDHLCFSAFFIVFEKKDQNDEKLKILEMLLPLYKASINDNDYPLIHMAVHSENVKALKLLIKHGLDINAVNSITHGCNTALHYAVDSQWQSPSAESIIQLLLDEGADVTIPNSKGVTPFDSAEEKHNDEHENIIYNLLLPYRIIADLDDGPETPSLPDADQDNNVGLPPFPPEAVSGGFDTSYNPKKRSRQDEESAEQRRRQQEEQQLKNSKKEERKKLLEEIKHSAKKRQELLNKIIVKAVLNRNLNRNKKLMEEYSKLREEVTARVTQEQQEQQKQQVRNSAYNYR